MNEQIDNLQTLDVSVESSSVVEGAIEGDSAVIMEAEELISETVTDAPFSSIFDVPDTDNVQQSNNLQLGSLVTEEPELRFVLSAYAEPALENGSAPSMHHRRSSSPTINEIVFDTNVMVENVTDDLFLNNNENTSPLLRSAGTLAADDSTERRRLSGVRMPLASPAGISGFVPQVRPLQGSLGPRRRADRSSTILKAVLLATAGAALTISSALVYANNPYVGFLIALHAPQMVLAVTAVVGALMIAYALYLSLQLLRTAPRATVSFDYTSTSSCASVSQSNIFASLKRPVIGEESPNSSNEDLVNMGDKSANSSASSLRR